jgi:hypothetical protein
MTVSVLDQGDAGVSTAVPGIRGPAGIIRRRVISGTTLTLTTDNQSELLIFTSGSAVTVTYPTGLGSEFEALLLQYGRGRVSVVAGAGATRRAATSATGTAYQYATASVMALQATDEFLLTGEVSA